MNKGFENNPANSSDEPLWILRGKDMRSAFHAGKTSRDN